VVLFRLVFGLMLLAAIGCFGMSLVTRDPMWRRRGVLILKWTLFTAVGFFAVLLVSGLVSGAAVDSAPRFR
jgi:hypothetical protein